MKDKEKDIEKRYREFVIYFRELDRIGAPYNTNDLIRKATELRLPIPTDEEIEKIERIPMDEINEMIDRKLDEEMLDKL